MPDQDNNQDLETSVVVQTINKKTKQFAKNPVDASLNVEKSLVNVLSYLVKSQEKTSSEIVDNLNELKDSSFASSTVQNKNAVESNEHLVNIADELTVIEKSISGLYKFFDNSEKEKDVSEEEQIEKIASDYLKNILTTQQEQLTELRMLNEQFVDFFEMNEKNAQEQKEQAIERDREAAAPPPTPQQPKVTNTSTTDQNKNESMFSSFGSIAKSTFGGFLSFGKSLFSGLGKIFGVLFSVVSAPFKFISSALGSILSFIPGFGIISKLMPSFNMGLGGLLSTLGIGALGYVGFKYLTDDKYKAGVDKYMGGIMKFFSPFINAIKGFFDTPVGKAISGFVGGLWKEHIQPALKGTWEAIKTGIDDFGKTFLGEENWGQLKKSFFSIREWITDKLPKSYDELSNSIKIMTNSIVDNLNTLIYFVKGIASVFGVSGDNFKPFNKPFPETQLSGTPYTTQGTFSGSTEQMKNLIDLSRKFEGGDDPTAINKLSGAAGYHQFMPSTFSHLISKLKQGEFLQDVNLSAKGLGKPELKKDHIDKIQKEYSKLETKEERSKYIANLDPDIQDVFFIAFNKDIMGTMKRLLGREVSPFEMKFAGFGTGNVVPIIKSAEKGERDSTYNVLKRAYAQSAPGGKQLTDEDLASLSVKGDKEAFFELAKKSRMGNFESLVNQNPYLFYKKEANGYNKNILLKPSETIDEYKKYLASEIGQIEKTSNKIDSHLEDATSSGSMAGKGLILKYGIPTAFSFGAVPGLTALAAGAMWLNQDLKDIFYRKTKNAGIYAASGEFGGIPITEEEFELMAAARSGKPVRWHWGGMLEAEETIVTPELNPPKQTQSTNTPVVINAPQSTKGGTETNITNINSSGRNSSGFKDKTNTQP